MPIDCIKTSCIHCPDRYKCQWRIVPDEPSDKKQVSKKKNIKKGDKDENNKSD